jgi:hypothetical protein
MAVLFRLTIKYLWPLLSIAQALLPSDSAAAWSRYPELPDSQPQADETRSARAEDPVDFRKQIYPLLEQHCLKCHNNRQADGDLRLDDELAARQGGHTGSLIFGPTPEQSELYRRITATEPGYRMPKRGAPLSEPDIELFRRWIATGASYQLETAGNETIAGQPVAGSLKNVPPERPAGSLLTMDGWVQWWLFAAEQLSLPRFGFLNWWGWLIAGWLGLMILKVLGTLVFGLRLLRSKANSVRSKHPTRQAAAEPDQKVQHPSLKHPLGRLNPWISWKRLLSSFLIVGCLGILAFQNNLIHELRNQQTATPAFSGRPQPSPSISFDRSRLTLPTNPMHPPRLGGVYYRGNDERDPSLFNGGFYRTAELEVWLINERGERIEWGHEIADQQLSIELTIQRSPGTTPELFSPRIMSTAYLRRFRETSLQPDSQLASEIDESYEIPLQVLEPDQRWSATIPLEPLAAWTDGRTAGVVYLFYGPTFVDGQKGRVHYGIRYQLGSTDGRITPQSTLWMGSLYDLGGRVLIPQEGEVLLDHWFDFRPIPEIEGENPNLPELLGIPEHEKQWID